MRPNKLIQFYLTDLCNSRCKTCDIWKIDLISVCKHVDYNKVIEIITQFPDADYVFGGGEFTLYEYKDELLSYCRKHDINYTILSNAISINTLMELVDKYNIKNVTISCDGIRHDWIRGIPGNLENIEYFVSLYKDKIDNLKISYTYSSFNEDCTDKDMALFRSWGFDKIYLCIASEMSLLDNISNKRYIPTNLDGLRMHMDMFYDKDREYLDRIFNKWPKKKCDSTSSVFTIYTNGDIVRCQSYLSDVVLGNIYTLDYNGFSDIVNKLEEKRYQFKCPYDKKCGLLCQRRYD